MRTILASEVSDFDPADVCAIRLSAEGYPPVIRLVVPVQVDNRGLDGHIAIISARSSVLVRHLQQAHSHRFPDPEKVRQVIATIRRGHPLRTPILTVPTLVSPASAFTFSTGQHRTAVLHQLGANRIPVAVPWERAEDFLCYLG